MKKGCILMGTLGITMLMGYGAWCLYKKIMPDEAEDVKNDMKNALKEMGKIPEDMKKKETD